MWFVYQTPDCNESIRRAGPYQQGTLTFVGRENANGLGKKSVSCVRPALRLLNWPVPDSPYLKSVPLSAHFTHKSTTQPIWFRPMKDWELDSPTAG
ncbi:unnamed protein product [Protopolystoma xenopodis]|uniref:Uncharacterized protein n=1 Tax=Protopolystoma xenopodis TaxID=117903 RepID=A0A3S5CGE6_9PLAT|nr:unnamed protein product [Protopolystoma xenopodis]